MSGNGYLPCDCASASEHQGSTSFNPASSQQKTAALHSNSAGDRELARWGGVAAIGSHRPDGSMTSDFDPITVCNGIGRFETRLAVAKTGHMVNGQSGTNRQSGTMANGQSGAMANGQSGAMANGQSGAMANGQSGANRQSGMEDMAGATTQCRAC